MKLVLTVSNVRRFSLAIWIILILNGIPWSSALSTKVSLSLSLSPSRNCCQHCDENLNYFEN